MRGVNDQEAPELLEWALSRNFELRFIEQMPLDAERGWTERNVITAAEIHALLSTDYALERIAVSGTAHQPSGLKYDDGKRLAAKRPELSWER